MPLKTVPVTAVVLGNQTVLAGAKKRRVVFLGRVCSTLMLMTEGVKI